MPHSLWVVVDVFIGLILVYLLLGMIATALQEALAGWLNLRGECLRRGLQSLLRHDADATTGKAADWLYRRVAGHALIQPDGDARHPSYVSAANFSAALVAGLLDGSQAPLATQVEGGVAKLPDGPAKQALTTLLVRAGGDLDQLQSSIERWFDDAMDRVSGVYKRISQNFLLAFGVVVALVGNVDTIEIALALQRDPAALQNVVAAAEEVAKGPAPAAPQVSPNPPQQALARARATADELAELNLPTGWSPEKLRHLANPLVLFAKVCGLLMTALAVSLGAPFWFDLLQKVLNLRTAGPKPARADAD